MDLKKDFNRVFTKDELFCQLDKLNIPKGKILLMHSSFRSVGSVVGGAVGFLDALIEYFTKDGGLFCVPTHTWNNIGKSITLDMTETKTCLGILSDLSAADPRALRSENPTHSIAVFGDRERAREFVKDELFLSSGTAPESVYGKLFREGGFVLLVGVSHNRNTYLHAVDEILDAPNRLRDSFTTVGVKRAGGEVITSKMRMMFTDYTNDISLHFPLYEPAFRYHGAITDGFIGNAPTQACDAVIMKEVVALIRERAGGEDPLKNLHGISPRLYC